ncbi:MAG TPA: ABC transporter permease [Stellaceae bacterium]|nr:ABC transporter permease [Stellaceae bacterium]
MSDLAQASAIAWALILDLDGDLFRIVRLSLGVSLTAVAVAAIISLPLGAALAVYGFRGRAPVIVILNALMGLPPVVVGLAVYLLLSRAGPLGMLGLLFTPGAMVVAQAILVTPIVTVLVWRAVSEPWAAYGDALLVDGASRLRAIPELLAMSGAGLLTALLAGFGRAIAEVGAIIIVGGNIAGVTRTMTTAIALETSKGNLPLALALGIILIALSIGVSAVAFLLANRGFRP